MFSHRGRDAAGCMGYEGGDPRPASWSVYLDSPDTEATVAAAQRHGGQVYVEPMEIPRTGRMAFVGDASGAGVGVWQALEFPGFEVRDEPGAVTWFETFSRAYDADVAFYRDVFGWDTHVMSDADDFRYTTLGEGDAAAAGILDASELPEEAPTGWLVYFRVEDCDAACARVGELGGRVLQAPQDSPFGRVATVADPQGAAFRLIGTARS